MTGAPRVIGPSLAVTAAVVLVSVACAVPALLAQTGERRLVRPAAEGRRVALVIGNNAYGNSPLRNAVSDAHAVSAALDRVGFVVTALTDLTMPQMERAVDAFASGLEEGDAALFYFAGHGVQVDGENYLIPVDFSGVDEADVKYRSYSASRLHEKLQSRARVRVIILDACRDNPFRSTRSASRGLAEMSARGSLIAFATSPGTTASDNPRGSNGLFTEHLLDALKRPGLSASELFRVVRERVNAASGGRQFPWVWDGLIGNFALHPGDAAAVPSSAAGGRRDLELQAELALWDAIKNSSTAAAFEDYLRRYPAGQFRIAAEERLAGLRPGQRPEPRPVESTAAPVTASEPGSLRGKVVAANWDPVASAHVAIEKSGRRFELQTEKDGYFLQIGLPPGAYRVTASKQGIGTSTRDVDVAAGRMSITFIVLQ